MESENPDTLLLQRYLAGTQQLKEALYGLTELQLDLTLEPGSWSIRQIVHHLADDGDVYSFVIKRAIASPGSITRFEGFPGNEPWGCALYTSTRKIDSSLKLFEAHRESVAELVEAVPGALKKEALFIGEDGKDMPFPVDSILLMLIDHLDEHIRSIRDIRAKHGLN
ncbi:MAG: DinB family protein [Anaerolineaceae bacterium]